MYSDHSHDQWLCLPVPCVCVCACTPAMYMCVCATIVRAHKKCVFVVLGPTQIKRLTPSILLFLTCDTWSQTTLPSLTSQLMLCKMSPYEYTDCSLRGPDWVDQSH